MRKINQELLKDLEQALAHGNDVIFWRFKNGKNLSVPLLETVCLVISAESMD